MQQYGNAANLTAVLAGPFGSAGSTVKLATVLLPASGWKGAVSPYFQTVEVAGISRSSLLNLQPDEAQLESFRHGGIALFAENNDGEVTIYAIGNKPAADLQLQTTAMEVVA